MITSLPNLLTLSRIVIVPVLVALFFVDGPEARWVALGFYAVAAMTDFFDGYIARNWDSFSPLGRFLDPIADKVLVGSVIFMLVAMDRVTGINIIPALVILVREILVSGLREYLADVQVRVPVSSLAKWKTTIQMFALGFLIVGDASPPFIPSVFIGEVGIWAAAILTLITGYDYFRSGLTHVMETTSNDRKNNQKDNSST